MDSSVARSTGRRLLFLVALLGLAMLASPAFAGQAQEASIIGQVTDESGAVLPGVTVTATSPALQVPQVIAVSTERGEYRLAPLPIGTYVLQFELPGFGILRRQDIRLTAGFTARVDVQLKVGTLAETVTVSGAAPVVDVSSTAARTQLTREALDIIPTSRSGIQSAMVQAPGVRTNLDFGNATTNPDFRVFGRSHDSWTMLEGVVTTSSKSNLNGSGSWFDYAALEETTVQTLGNPAESPTQGIQVNAILKSGGNDFHGSGFWAQSSRRLQSDNLDATLRARGVRSANPIKERWDLSGDLGGRIIRNKLWFYYAGRGRKEDTFILDAFKPDGSRASTPSLQWFSTEKLSYQISQANKLIGLQQHQERNNDAQASQFVQWNSRQLVTTGADTSKLEWQLAKGNKFVSLQYGIFKIHVDRTGFLNDVATLDQLSQIVTGLNWDASTRSFEGRRNARGTLTWYKPDLFYGNHDFKTGFDYSVANADRTGSDRQFPVEGRKSKGFAPNYRLIFRNGVPFQLQALNFPVYPASRVSYLGIYVQDSWTIARRVTFNLGLRYAHDNGSLPVQCREASPPPLDGLYPAQCFPFIQTKVFNPVVPRLHVAYDLTGDGKTVIKGGWGRYAHMRYADEVNMANGNVFLTSTFRWNDLNANQRFDLSEVNFDRNGPDFVSTTVFGSTSLAFAVQNPNEKEPMSDEVSVSVERQLIPNFAVRMTGIYSRTFNNYRIQNNLRPYSVHNIPITNADPGPDGRRGTGDDPGTFITYYDYPAALAGAAFQQPMLVNDPTANESYKSFELAASKRMANRWMLMTSYSVTRLQIPYTPTTGGGFTVNLPTLDPNAEIFAANNTWEWLGRVTGAYVFPAEVQVSANFEHRSGTPWARTVSFTGGRQIPSITLRVEPVGSRRLPNVNILNLRAEKSFRLRQAQRLALRLNVYNALNINSALNVTQLSGASFLKPTSIAPPRVAEFSASYSF